MKMLRAAVLPLAVLTGCATTETASKPAAPAEQPAAQPQKLALTNIIPFDVAACGPRALKLTPFNTEVLAGALLTLSPGIDECFVDPANREGDTFDAKLKVTVGDSVLVEVSGVGPSAAGKACVERVVKALPLTTATPAVSAEVPVTADTKVVKLGDNPANDAAGKLRLAQRAQCECYAKLGTMNPPALVGEAEITAEGKNTVSLSPNEELAACLTPRLTALDLGKQPVKLKWPLLLENAYASEADAAAVATLRFQALERQRAQRTADIIITSGQRFATAVEYDAQAKAYKAKPNKAALEKLKTKCAEVLAFDAEQAKAVNALVSVLTQSQQLAATEKAKEPQWEQVETRIAQQLTATQAQVEKVAQQTKNDEGACPKTK